MTELERDLGRQWFEQVWNQGRREAIAELLAPDAVIHDGDMDTVGPEGFYPFFDRINGTLSDVHVTVNDTIAGGDKICIRWSCTGKHTGDGLGIPASGTNVHISGISILRVANGKLAEGWQNWDMLGMMQQMQGLKKAATYIGA
jgi:steroid delta-isomerase-like uncharacterized protein